MKKLGVVLGAGSAYGFAHIGVLKVLEKNNIKISYISGTSIGAVIGALYASGISAIQLENIAKETKITDLLDFTVPKSGFLYGKKIEDLISKLTYKKEFKDLAIPLAVVAADLTSGEKIVFTAGHLARAVRASISIPALFMPVQQHKHILVDGAIIDPIPIDVVKEMGADVIIAIDLTVPTKYKKGRALIPKANSFTEEVQKQFIHSIVYNFNQFLMTKNRLGFLYKLFFKIIRPNRIEGYIKRLISKNYTTPDILKIILKTENLMINELAREKLKDADVIIRPNLQHITSYEFNKIDYYVKEGEKSAELVMPKIKKLLK